MENTIKRTECRGCGKFFVGTSVFDEHRIGMDCEKKLVHIIIEGKNTYEEHDVWFMIAWRARAKSATYGKQTDDDEEEDNDNA